MKRKRRGMLLFILGLKGFKKRMSSTGSRKGELLIKGDSYVGL